MGKTSSSSKNKYNAKAYDRINFVVKKGKKDTITEHANKKGESVNAFINRAVDEIMEKESE